MSAKLRNCTECEREFKSDRHRCHLCAPPCRNAVSPSHVDKLTEIVRDQGRELVGVWRNASDRSQVYVTARCPLGHVTHQRGAGVRHGTGCPTCANDLLSAGRYSPVSFTNGLSDPFDLIHIYVFIWDALGVAKLGIGQDKRVKGWEDRHGRLAFDRVTYAICASLAEDHLLDTFAPLELNVRGPAAAADLWAKPMGGRTEFFPLVLLDLPEVERTVNAMDDDAFAMDLHRNLSGDRTP